MQVSNQISNESKSKAPEKGSIRYKDHLFFHCFLYPSIIAAIICSFIFYVISIKLFTEFGSANLFFGLTIGFLIGYFHYKWKVEAVDSLTGETYEMFFSKPKKGEYDPQPKDSQNPLDPSSTAYWTLGDGSKHGVFFGDEYNK